MATVSGYDQDFLSVTVAFPTAPEEVLARRLDYTHFSVDLDPVRRLAVATGVNIDGPSLVDLGRGDDWHYDDRAPVSEQTGPQVYAGNDLDRGHLVRRRDPVWGPPEIAATANFDTFAFTNAAPQAAGFNQGADLWLGLEDYVLTHAELYDERLSVFTAPVLDPEDPLYRGVQIPRRFWKIAAWATAVDDAVVLGSTGYLLDQTPQLEDVDLATARAVAVGAPPPLGPYRTYQVPVVDIATLTGLDLGPLVAADTLHDQVPVPAAALRVDADTVDRWTRLSSPFTIRF